MGTNTIYRPGRPSFAASGRAPPRAPVRAMQVLESLARARAALSLSDLSASLSMPKTSLLQLMRALEAARYVRRSASGFALGESTHLLAALVAQTNGFPGFAQQVLAELQQQTLETLLLGKLASDRTVGVYFERVESRLPMRFTPDLDQDRPLYCTALGKVLLAFAPPKDISAYVRTVKLERFTPATIKSRPALMKELEKVRKEGFALSADEMVPGGGALAVPVFDTAGSMRMALVIAAPSARLLPRTRDWSGLLQTGAARLSRMLAPG